MFGIPEVERHLLQALEVNKHSVKSLQGQCGVKAIHIGVGVATEVAGKPPDVLGEEGQRDTTTKKMPPRHLEVIDGEYERCSDAIKQEVPRKGDALESLALYGQVVEISSVEMLNDQEQ